MEGAETLFRTFANNGVDTCFTNPGTTEIPFLRALDGIASIKGVLCLFEGVCTGAADGYARMKGRPALTLLHLGPGLANGLANLHNARRARSPLINVVGDHATYHGQWDPPLESDILSLARAVSHWAKRISRPEEIASVAAEALTNAMSPPAGVATVVVPADCAWSEAGQPGDPVSEERPRPVDEDKILDVARVLKSSPRPCLILGGSSLLERGLNFAAVIKKATGAQVFSERFCARIQRGYGRFSPCQMPYFPEQIQEKLQAVSHIVLVEAQQPVSFFAYSGTPSCLTPENAEVHVLSVPGEDSIAALEELARELGPGGDREEVPEAPSREIPFGKLDPAVAGAILAAKMPEGTIVCNDSGTSGATVYSMTRNAAPHDWLPLTGGSIGQGIPLATGAALACPDRKVVCLEGDGGAMYTIQGLWTQAREETDVVTIIFSNRKYLILQLELARAGVDKPSKEIMDLLDLSRPEPGWVSIARGMGVNASRAETGKEFELQLETALNERGPWLIEAVI